MRTFWRGGRGGKLHRRKRCPALDKAADMYRTTLKNPRPQDLCRYCFPEEGEHGQDPKRP